MKHLILLSVLAFSITARSQGYANFGVSTLAYKSGFKNSVNIAAGGKFGNFGVGGSVDLYTSNKMLIPTVDLRYFYKRYFIAVQPGWTVYNKKGVVGSFAGSSIIGANFKKGEIGLTVFAGYQYYSFQNKQNSDVLKTGIAVLF